MNTLRCLMLALLIGLGTAGAPRAEDTATVSQAVDLYQTLGFNEMCPGAVKPNCSVEPTLVSAGTCMRWSCPGSVVDNSGKACVTESMVTCPDGQTVSTTSIDNVGCPVFSCLSPTITCPIVEQCPPGKSAVWGTNDKGCKVVTKCEDKVCPPTPKCTPDAHIEFSEKNGCKVGTCVKNNCPVVEQCPPGKTTVWATNDKGCKVVKKCEDKKMCPQVMNCPPGTTPVFDTNKDGCKIITKCEKKAACPVVEQCPPGKTTVWGSNDKGCKVVKKCEDKKDNNDSGKCKKIDGNVCGAIGMYSATYARDDKGCIVLLSCGHQR